MTSTRPFLDVRMACVFVLGALVAACGGPDVAQTGVQAPEAAAPPEGSGATAFIGVTVVPMDGERTLADQTVVVQDGRITAMGPAGELAVPDGALEVDGTGQYLMPGLAEMHGHLPSPDTPADVTENVLFLYVANGVTTVRGMQGHPAQLELRERVRSGELVGPQLFLAAPAMSGNTVGTVEDAERLVREYQTAGFDLLKVQEGLSVEVYEAIVATAREIDIPFGGHVSDSVGLFAALEAGQATVDHLDNYVEALVPEDAGAEPGGLADVDAMIESVDEDRMALVVDATLDAGTGVVPTMVLWENGIFGTRPSDSLLEEWTEVQYMPRDTVQGWSDAVDDRVAGADVASRQALADLRRRLLLALHDGGVPVLLGTDSPQIFSVPGFSVHREMALYVEAGLSPYEVLASGTRAVAEHFDAADEFGTVAVGQRADLLLLDANPLDDVANVARRSGVMVNGRWIPEDEIQERLAVVAASYAP